MSYESPRRRSSIATTQSPFPIHQRHHATNLHYHYRGGVAQSVPTGGVPVLSRKMVARRISEGESGRLKEELKCEACGKGYKHISSLAKHLWEHTPEWNVTSKLLISKHQQVQLLEAASILVSMNEGDEEDEELGPVQQLSAASQQQQQQQAAMQHQIAQQQLQQLGQVPGQHQHHMQQQQQHQHMHQPPHQQHQPIPMHLHSPGSYTLSPSPGPDHREQMHPNGVPNGGAPNGAPNGINGLPGGVHNGVHGHFSPGMFSPANQQFSPAAASSFSTFKHSPTPSMPRRNSLQFGMSTVAEDEDDETFGGKSPRASAPRFGSLYGSSVKEEDRERREREEVPSPTKSASSPEKYGDEKDDDDGVFGEMD